jgi:MFS transporter, YNFM family, putative membrane transport protein
MRRSLPPEAPGLPSEGLSRATLRRLLANRVLVAACLTGAGLFFSFMGVFSYIDFRLERPPFSLSPAVIGLIFVLWVMGAAGPLAGRLADRHGWRAVALGGLLLCAGGLTLSLVPVLGVVIVGLSLVTLGNFSAVTAAQLGVASATDRNRGVASAMYFSAYYVAGALGAYVPGLAWEHWHWSGVWAMALAAYAVGAGALVAAATLARPCAPSPAPPADSSSSSRTRPACAAAPCSGSTPGGASSSP